MCYSIVLRGNLQREVPLGIRVMFRRWNAGSLKASPGRVDGSDKGDQLEDDLLPHLIRVITINIDGAPVALVYCRSLRSLAVLLTSNVISERLDIFDRFTLRKYSVLHIYLN